MYVSITMSFHLLFVSCDSFLSLSHSKEFNIDVLKKFIGLHDFKGKSIVDALRLVWQHKGREMFSTMP